MWDEDDTSGRFVQLICGVVLLVVAFCCGYIAISGWDRSYSHSYRHTGAGGLCVGAIYLGIRCLWYAVTGKDNVNRDDF